MIRKLVIGCWLLVAGCWSGFAETLVHPQRDDLDGRSFLEVGIPLADYTNGLVFYMDAAAGDYNAGATDYSIPDLSISRVNFSQSGTGYQPALVEYKGRAAYKGDGVDDSVFGYDGNLGGDLVRMSVWFAATNAHDGTLISRGWVNASYSHPENAGIILRSSGKIEGVVGYASGGFRKCYPAGTYADGEWHHVEMWTDGTNTYCTVDGTDTDNIAGYTFADAVPCNRTAIFAKPRIGSYAMPFNGWISEVRIQTQ